MNAEGLYLVVMGKDGKEAEGENRPRFVFLDLYTETCRWQCLEPAGSWLSKG